MVPAALRHRLINMIAPEIIVSVVYLCSITELVIVHVVESYPVWRSQGIQNLLPLIQKEKITNGIFKMFLNSGGRSSGPGDCQSLCC